MTTVSTMLRQSTAVLLVAVIAAGCTELRWHEMDRFLLEHDLMRECMGGKGYALVPAEKR